MNRSAFRSRDVATAIAAGLCVIAAAATALGWGISAHRMITSEAIGLLPGEMQAFFRANSQNLAALSIEPDALSEESREEAPNHFMDLDAFDKPPFDKIPLDEKAFVRKFGKDALKEGRLPWAIGDRYRMLVDAMRERDGEGVLRNAGYVAHYVADATMPLHATKNYKGQLTGNVIFEGNAADRHVHVRFEVGMIDANLDDIRKRMEAEVGSVREIKDPAGEAFALLKDSYSHIEPVLAADGELVKPGSLVEPRYYTEMYRRVGGLAVQRMALARSQVASYWASAWIEAGRPELGGVAVVLKEPALVPKAALPAMAPQGSLEGQK